MMFPLLRSALDIYKPCFFWDALVVVEAYLWVPYHSRLIYIAYHWVHYMVYNAFCSIKLSSTSFTPRLSHVIFLHNITNVMFDMHAVYVMALYIEHVAEKISSPL